MKIRGVRFHLYRLTLKRPLTLKGRTFSAREGWIVEIDAGDCRGFGEIAPLPGFSRETAEEVREQLDDTRRTWPGKELPPLTGDAPPALRSMFAPLSFAPSVRCGMETALLDISAQVNDKPFAALFGGSLSSIAVNGLISADVPDTAGAARQLVESGYRYIKLKMSGDVDACVAKVTHALRGIDGRAELIVDANRGWDVERAVRFGKAVGRGALRYVEEPFADLSAVPRFYRETGIPVALDESLTAACLDEVVRLEGVRTLVLKPTLQGGFLKTCDLMRQAHGGGLEAVVSSCFESDIGISFLAQLASCREDQAFAGLDTLKYFKERLLKESVVIENGRCRIVPRLVRGDNIEFSLLGPVP